MLSTDTWSFNLKTEQWSQIRATNEFPCKLGVVTFHDTECIIKDNWLIVPVMDTDGDGCTAILHLESLTWQKADYDQRLGIAGGNVIG